MRPVKDVIYRELEGAYLLYHIATDMIFGLNQTGSRVWQLLQGDTPIEHIGAILAHEFEADPVECQQDLVRFLEKLSEHQLITLQG